MVKWYVQIYILYNSPFNLGINHIITCLYIICFNLYTVEVTLGLIQNESYNRMLLLGETNKGCNVFGYIITVTDNFEY